MFGWVSHAFHAVTHAVSSAVSGVTSFVAHNWRQILVITAAVAVGVLVTVATGGLGAPLLVAALAGGLAAGGTSYTLNWLLTPSRPAWSWTGFAEATLVSGVLAVATAGVGEVVAPVASSVVSSVVPDAVTAAVPDAVSTAVGNATAGSVLGAGQQVVLNAVEGRPLGDGVVTAAVVGGATGAVVRPVTDGLTSRGGPEGPVNPDPVAAGPLSRFAGWFKGNEPPPGPVEPAPAAPTSPSPVADVNALAASSPTLRADIASLQNDGWTITYGEQGHVYVPGGKPYDGGSFASWSQKVVVVDPSETTPAAVAQTLSHEFGHATTGEPAPAWNPNMSRDQYVDANTQGYLRSEGEATLRNAVVRQEILDATGTDIGIGGVRSPEYARIANDPTLTYSQKVDAIARIFAHGERPSTDGTAADYYDYYAKGYRTAWDNWAQGTQTASTGTATTNPAPTASMGFLGALDEASAGH
ncbi:MAG TPA: hypothetical protein VFF73_00450 [Planctomycetota bacterium]|nr:hypothetical protein [Planctomycetota bacterium]